MIDIVERLRNWTQIYPEDAGDDEGALYQKAADEIEGLREALLNIVAVVGLQGTNCGERVLKIARAALEGE